jgi:two-component system sensor histidine kinase KdpD
MSSIMPAFGAHLSATSARTLRRAGLPLLLVALFTAALLAASRFVEIDDDVSVVYLIPVLVAALRGGAPLAAISGVAGLGAAIVFFPPLRDFRPEHVVDLFLFALVAVATGAIGANVRRAKMRAQTEDVRDALRITRDLQTPLAAILRWTSLLAQAPQTALAEQGAALGPWARTVPSAIGLPLLLVALLTVALSAAWWFVDVEHVTIIYLIPVLVAATRGGVVPALVAAVAGLGTAVFFFYPPLYDFRVDGAVQVVDVVLFAFVAVVTGKLAADVRQARMRAQADALRDALIGSVSHELRTPLASIMGSASILAQSPQIAKDERLSPLVRLLREEAERLNDHIQNLLDATSISSDGIRPRKQWVDPCDIVNAAVAHKRRLLEGHAVNLTVADDLPLVEVDPSLVEKALGQLIENAVKYSAPSSPIEITAEQNGRAVRLAVRDHGAGMSVEELQRIWDRFYRSPRHRDTTAGSGLGLWIARALVTACGGRMQAASAGIGRGAVLSISLPVDPHTEPEHIDE